MPLSDLHVRCCRLPADALFPLKTFQLRQLLQLIGEVGSRSRHTLLTEQALSTLESAASDTHNFDGLICVVVTTFLVVSGFQVLFFLSTCALSLLVCSSCSPVAPGGPVPLLNVREEVYLERLMGDSMTHKCNLTHLHS